MAFVNIPASQNSASATAQMDQLAMFCKQYLLQQPQWEGSDASPLPVLPSPSSSSQGTTSATVGTTGEFHQKKKKKETMQAGASTTTSATSTTDSTSATADKASQDVLPSSISIPHFSSFTLGFLEKHQTLFQLLLNAFIYIHPQNIKSKQFLYLRTCCNLVLQDFILQTRGECFHFIFERALDKMDLFSLWLRQFFYVLSDGAYWNGVEMHMPQWLRTKMRDTSGSHSPSTSAPIATSDSQSSASTNQPTSSTTPHPQFVKRKLCLHLMIYLCWSKVMQYHASIPKPSSTLTPSTKHNALHVLVRIVEIAQWIEHAETAQLFVHMINQLLENVLSTSDAQEVILSSWLIVFLLPSYMLTVHPSLDSMTQQLFKCIAKCVEILINREAEDGILQPCLRRMCEVTYALFPVTFTKFVRLKCASHYQAFDHLMSHMRFNPRIFLPERNEYSCKVWRTVDRKNLINEALIHNASFGRRDILDPRAKTFESDAQAAERDLSRESWWHRINILQNLIDFHFTSSQQRPITYTEEVDILQKQVLTLKNELLVERSLRAQHAAYLSKRSNESSRRLQYESIIKSQQVNINQQQNEVKNLREEIKRLKRSEMESRNRLNLWDKKIQETLQKQTEKLEKITQRNLALSEHADRLETKNEEMTKQCSLKEEKISSLLAQVSATSAVQEKLSHSELQLESLKQEVQMWESNHSKLNNTINKYKTMGNEMMFQDRYISALSQKVSESQKSYRNLVSSLRAKTDLIQKMQQEGEKVKQDNLELKKLLQMEQNISKQKLDEVQHKYTKIRNTNMALNHRILELSQELADHERRRLVTQSQ